MPLEEFEQEFDGEVCNDEEVVNENAKAGKDLGLGSAIATPSTSKTSTSKARISPLNFINDPDIKRDTKFLDKFQQVMTDSNTSKLFISYITQF